MRSIFLIVLLLVVLTNGQELPDFDITNEEIVSLVNEMRNADTNKARPGQIQLDYQGHTGSMSSDDRAPKPLFKSVDTSLFRKPTYEALLKLEDNFEPRTGVAEVDTPEEIAEIDQFLTLILNTQPWSILGKYLKNRGHPFATDKATMKKHLKQLWFAHYSRARGLSDTSGFEHIFIGELKNGEVSGLHNWLRFYRLEQNQRDFDYRGFLVKRGNILAAIKFLWKNQPKRSGTLLVGTSPEFDMALYTLCFLSRRGRNTCNFELDHCPMSITSYDIRQNRQVFIGSSFPSAGRMSSECRTNTREF